MIFFFCFSQRTGGEAYVTQFAKNNHELSLKRMNSSHS